MRWTARFPAIAILVPALAHADAALFDGPITLVPPGREVSQVSLAHDPSSGLAMVWAEDGVAYLRLTESDGGAPTTFVVAEPVSGAPDVQLDALGGGLVQFTYTGGFQTLGRRILPGRAGLGPVFPIVPAELPSGTRLRRATLAPNGDLLQLGLQQEGCVPYPDAGCETSRLVARVRGPDNSDTAAAVLLETTGFAELETEAYQTDIVAVPGGPFLVIYERDRDVDPDADIRLIAAGRDATLVAGPIQISSHTTGDQRSPRIALTPDGGFIAVWSSEGAPFPSPADILILGRRFDASGSPIGHDFQVAGTIPGNVSRQTTPRVAVAPDGTSLVRWRVTDDACLDEEGQLLAADRTPVGAVFDPGGPCDATLTADTVAVGPGRFFTTWRVDGRLVEPPIDRVEGRTIQRVPWDRIFRAHFEGRDLDEWNEVVEGRRRP